MSKIHAVTIVIAACIVDKPIIEASNSSMLQDFTMVINCGLLEAHSTGLSIAYPCFFAHDTIFFLHITAH